MVGLESQRPFRLGMGLISGRLADIAETTIALAQKCSGILVIRSPFEGHSIEQRKLRKKEENLRRAIEMDTWIDFIEGDIRIAEDRKEVEKDFKKALGKTQRFDVVVLNSKDPSEDLNRSVLSDVVDYIRPYMHIGGKITLYNGELELAASSF